MSSIFTIFLTLIRVIKCARVICCWQEPWKHSLPRVIRAWKSIAKKNTISFCSSSEKVLPLNFKMIQFCCLSREVLEKAGRCSTLPPISGETSAWCVYDKDHLSVLRIKNTSESDPLSYEVSLKQLYNVQIRSRKKLGASERFSGLYL